ncbi:MAG: CHAT domain-containing protein [Dehalococcoidia bacterium]
MTVADISAPSGPKRHRRRGGPEAAPAAAASAAPLPGLDHMFEQVDAFELVALPDGPAGARRRRGPAATATIDVDLGAEEQAVVLLDEDGVLSWHLGEAEAPAATRRRRGPVPTGPRTVSFTLPVGADGGGPAATRSTRLIGRIAGKVVARVLKFAVSPVIDAVVEHMEGPKRTGFVQIVGPTRGEWVELDDPSQVRVREVEEPRVLLFIHGTFSSTIGGFGALTATAPGQAFLEAAVKRYDAVIGFDHRTLSVDPEENARDLLRWLRGIAWEGRTPTFDCVMHSRGGLVYRSLVEQVLPASGAPPKFDRAVFVAAANSGTELARAANWSRMIDVSSNLAMAAGRGLMALGPAGAIASEVVDSVMTGVAALVKSVVAKALTEEEIPGLAAMEPSGKFITALNQSQAGQPAPGTPYLAVTSNFEADLAQPGVELPAKLLGLLKDQVVDQLLGADNDLVVDVRSMTAIDPGAGSTFFQRTMAYGTNGVVYHTNYFAQAATATALGEWLMGAALVARPRGRGKPTAAVVAALPPEVNRRILILEGGLGAAEAVARVKRAKPAWVIVERTANYRYALTPDEIVVRAGAGGTHAIAEALNLHEDQCSILTGPAGVAGFPTMTSPHTSAMRMVVIEGGASVGVVPSAADLLRTEPAPRRTRRDPGDFPPRRRRSEAMADGGQAAQPPPAVPAPTEPEPVTVHFKGEMPSEVLVDEVVAIEVVLSREALEVAAGVAGGVASAGVDPTQALIVVLQPKVGFVAVGDTRIQLPVPAPGSPHQFFLDVQAKDLGEGRVDLLLRQGPRVVATVSLRPAVVAQRQGAVRALTAVGTPSLPAGRVPARHQLHIYSQVVNGQTSFRFRLELETPAGTQFADGVSPPLRVEPSAYVDALYKQIEDFWSDVAEDQAAFDQQLRNRGVGLFRELFPENVQRALWTHRAAIEAIEIVGEEPFIPWEIVHLCEPGQPLGPDVLFLGQLGLTRWLTTVTCPSPVAITVDRAKTKMLVPSYQSPDWALPAAAAEGGWLSDTLGASAAGTKWSEVNTLLATPGAFDLLHFAGHGHADAGAASDQELVLGVAQDTTGKWAPRPVFKAGDVRAQARLVQGCEGNRPIVVINACQVGRLGVNLTSIGGFADAFLQAGAGVFVGALWAVGDDVARTFVEHFYTRLMAGDTIAQATRAAREASRQAGEPTWLAYTVYAEPSAQVTFV